MFLDLKGKRVYKVHNKFNINEILLQKGDARIQARGKFSVFCIITIIIITIVSLYFHFSELEFLNTIFHFLEFIG